MLYALLQNQVEQFRKSRGEGAMKDYELAKMSLAELLQPTVERMADEEPERLAKLLTPERLAKMLTPETLAKMLTPEQRVAGLTPEQLATMLTSDDLAEKLEALPPEIKEKLKQRLH